jgi:tartrate dehydrogenase/decarboxylase/D-malate dehydrogenase
MIWSGAMMLEFLGQPEAASTIVRAIEDVIRSGPHTPDLGGTASTTDVGLAIAQRVADA